MADAAACGVRVGSACQHVVRGRAVFHSDECVLPAALCHGRSRPTVGTPWKALVPPAMARLRDAAHPPPLLLSAPMIARGKTKAAMEALLMHSLRMQVPLASLQPMRAPKHLQQPRPHR